MMLATLSRQKHRALLMSRAIRFKRAASATRPGCVPRLSLATM